ncbi:hypothetical protein GIB67_013720 [Kingdonia uniflora]|uniref:NPH3 domain-containing protein n=1 Tax=Kingdonia uniflora TaxID=39325 RepID=A0A7J7NQG3_9MAGN|nr:hypothetical protein GIB67_013720 [Kingdonia uniflora]
MLSIKACIHAAQNDLLPLRVVVQVLFCEQARAFVSCGQVPDLPNNIKTLLVTHKEVPSKLLLPLSTTTTDNNWSISGTKSPNYKISTLRMKLAEEENDKDDVNDDTASRSFKLKNFCYIPVRPKWMLNKLWSSNKSLGYTLNVTKIKKGLTVAIFGFGAAGFTTAEGASGVSRVIDVDLNPNSCGNQRLPIPYDELELHLTKFGFLKIFTVWNYHGEDATLEGATLVSPSFPPRCEEVPVDSSHEVHNSVLHNLDMNINGVVEDVPNVVPKFVQGVENDASIKFDSNLREVMSELYLGCVDFSVLTFVLELYKLKKEFNESNNIIFRDIVRGPMTLDTRYNKYCANVFLFVTKDYEANKVNQNSGVITNCMTTFRASCKDMFTEDESTTYYRVLRDIIQLEYRERYKPIIFRCDWVKVTQGVKLDKEVNLRLVYVEDEICITSEQHDITNIDIGQQNNEALHESEEHVIITIFANCGVPYGGGDAYSIGAITVMKAYYKQSLNFICALLIVLTTQSTPRKGFSIKGLHSDAILP